LQKNLKNSGAGINLDEKTRLAGTLLDEYSSNNSNLSHGVNKDIEAVNNMLNEASTFNCH